MRFIQFLLGISWQHIIIATIAGLVSGCGNALLISLINQSINRSAFQNALLYFAILCVFILITSTVAQFMLITLSQNAIYQLRLKLSRNVLSAPLQHLERLGENRLIVTLTEDVRTLAHAVSAIPNLCIDFATVVGCFIYLAWLSNILFVLTIASTVTTIWFVQTRLTKAQQLFSKARDEEDNLVKYFQAIISGIKELKLNLARRDDFLVQNLQGSANSLRQKNSTAMKSFVVANALGQSSQFVSLGFILFVLPLLMHIPTSMLSTYILTCTFIALPMQNLLNRLPELVRGNIALRKIERMKLSLLNHAEAAESVAAIRNPQSSVLELERVTYLYHPERPPEFRPHGPGAEDLPDDLLDGPPEGLLDGPPDGHFPEGHPPDGHSFEGSPQGHPLQSTKDHAPDGFLFPGHPEVSDSDHLDANQGLTYPPPHRQNGKHPLPPPGGGERGFLLGPISLTLHSGEITFIVGGNGSGKSTLAKLITGLYPPQSGAIYLNDEQITEHNLEWYRQHFSAIFTDFHLFDSCLGFKQFNLDEEVEKYLKQLQIDHKVQVKNGVLSTTRLSQGQRKRLALLAAYLEDRPIYLFDEWASDQEPLFRDLFYQELLVKLKEQGKTVVVITHDDRYFHLADQIIKLDYGRIVLSQTPQRSYSNLLP